MALTVGVLISYTYFIGIREIPPLKRVPGPSKFETPPPALWNGKAFCAEFSADSCHKGSMGFGVPLQTPPRGRFLPFMRHDTFDMMARVMDYCSIVLAEHSKRCPLLRTAAPLLSPRSELWFDSLSRLSAPFSISADKRPTSGRQEGGGRLYVARSCF